MGLYMGYQRHYIVLYRREDIMAPADPPFAFKCMAENTEHAEEQCLNAEPDADIVWVVDTDDVQAAYADYWNTPAGFIDDINDPAGFTEDDLNA